MSKDLEKEYLEDLDHYDEGMGIHSTSYQKCKERLIRLARIDNANPSEALECLDNLGNSLSLANELLRVTDTSAMDKYITAIKQALLKAQERENENARYKQLEEQLGCPLEVVAKAITYGIAYELKNGLIESEPHISLTECGYGYILCSGSSTRKVIENGEFQTKDYKKTWWLKEDKSE